MRAEIDKNGHEHKYSDAELQAMVQSDTVANERFHVRFMEYGYTERNGKAGTLGAPMQGTSGRGAKYWSTTFDQIEDCDCNAELIAKKLGLPDYSSDKEYVLIVIDTETAAPITGVKSIVPTFEALSAFANEELPNEFPSEVTDRIMTPEFQELYAQQYRRAEAEGVFDDRQRASENFSNYVEVQDLSDEDKDNLVIRFNMHDRLGNNAEYEGTGLTKNLLANGQHAGAIETLNFERQQIDLDQMVLANAIYPMKVA